MRVIKLDGMRVVHAGQLWSYTNIDPSSKEAIPKLERNESLITWLQPDAGGIEDQVPVIRITDDGFYVLSLRCMKVVFRHVRLKKGFCNREYSCCGMWKLKIPMCLMREKIRTQSRFNVLRNGTHMQTAKPPPGTGSVSSSIVQKINTFLERAVFPLAQKCTQPGGREALPASVSFVSSQDDALRNMLSVVESECPRLLLDKNSFIQSTGRAFDAYTLHAAGAPQGATR